MPRAALISSRYSTLKKEEPYWKMRWTTLRSAPSLRGSVLGILSEVHSNRTVWGYQAPYKSIPGSKNAPRLTGPSSNPGRLFNLQAWLNQRDLSLLRPRGRQRPKVLVPRIRVLRPARHRMRLVREESLETCLPCQGSCKRSSSLEIWESKGSRKKACVLEKTSE